MKKISLLMVLGLLGSGAFAAPPTFQSLCEGLKGSLPGDKVIAAYSYASGKAACKIGATDITQHVNKILAAAPKK